MCSKTPLFYLLSSLVWSVTAHASDTALFKDAAQSVTALDHAKEGPDLQQKSFLLAQSLYKAGLPFAALKSLEPIISAGPSHSQYVNALSLLCDLATQYPSTELLASQFLQSSYERDKNSLKALDSAHQQSADFFIANRLLKSGKKSEAAALAMQVTDKSPQYAKAQYLLALCALDKGKDAIAHFDNVLDSIPASTKDAASFDLRNLALLGKGRLYYEQAYALPEENPARKDLAEKAVKAYQEVPRFSDAWSHALFELGWAQTLLDHYGDALGAIRSLEHPYFSKAFYPEAQILASIVYWYNCQWDRAGKSLALWKKKYEPLASALKLATDGKGAIPQAITDNLQSKAQYRVFEGLLLGLQNEKDRINQNDVLKNSPLPKRLNDYYDRAVSNVKKTQVNWNKEQIKETLAGLEALKTRASIISLETKTAEAKWLDQGRRVSGLKRERLARPYVPIDKNQFWWVTNAESWRDELGFYRLSVKSECYE